MADKADVLLKRAVDAIRALSELDSTCLTEPWITQEQQSEFLSLLAAEIENLRAFWGTSDNASEYIDDYEPPGGFVDVTDEEMKQAAEDCHPCIVVVGNPVDGLALVGPFSRFSVANDYGDLLKDTWFCAKLEAPAEFNPSWVNEESSGWEEDSEVPF